MFPTNPAVPYGRTKVYNRDALSRRGRAQWGSHQLYNNEESSPTVPVADPVSDVDVEVEAGDRLRRGDQTRARILEAAEKVFGEQGFHGASIVEITRDAGVGLGTFYVYFPSKLEIYRHLLRSHQQDLNRAARTAAQGSGDFRDNLRRSIQAFFDWVGDRTYMLRLLREAEFVDPSLVEELYVAPSEEYRKTLQRAMELGHIGKTDSEMLAWSVMGMTEFAILRGLVWPGKTKLEPEQFEAFIDILVRALDVKAR